MIKKIFNKLKSKDGKTILENFVSLSAIQMVAMVLPLITLPYVLRVIGFEKYGIIVFASSLISYFTSLTDFSFKITGVRDVAVFKHSPKKLNIIYSKIITVKTIFLIVSILLISSIVLLYPAFYEYKIIYFLSMLSLVGNVLFPEWFFQGIEKMRYITYLNISIKVFFFFCIFVFIKNEEDYWIYPLLQSLGTIGAGIVGQFLLVKKYRLKLLLLPKKIIISTIKSNFPIFVNQFLPTLYNNTSVFLLGIFDSKAMVGMYQAILTFVNLGITVVEILSRVFFPYLNRKKDAFTSYKKMMLIIVSIIGIGLLMANRIIFWYLNIEDPNAFWILLALVIGLFGYALSNIYGLNYFIIHRQDKLVMKNTLRASIIGFILAFPLVSTFGVLGTAINLSFSRWMMGGGLFYKYLKRLK
ncbi:oligosaccharide flippase family protein [Empedobacter falsenii]